jgi:hypothetical protein
MPRDNVGEELARVGIDAYKLADRSEVPEYTFEFKKRLGELAEKNLKPYIQTEEYKALPIEEQKLRLEARYKGEDSDLSPEQKKAYRGLGYKFPSLKKAVREQIKVELPYLYRLHNFRKNNRKADVRELYRQEAEAGRPIPQIKYYGEQTTDRGINYAAEKQNTALDAYQAKINENRKRRAMLPIDIRGEAIGQRKGGYIGQMNALGFSEGGNVGRKGMSVLGHMADPNYPMTTAEIESGKRSITEGRALRAVPIAEYATEAVKEMASGRNPTKAAEVASDLGRDRLSNRIKTFVKEMYSEPNRASKIAKENFGFKQDNPAVQWNNDEGLKWLKSNQAYTLEKSSNKTLTGPISKQTAFLGTNVDMFLPTKVLKSMPGAAGERRFRGDSRYDHLKKEIGDNFDIDQRYLSRKQSKGDKITVVVNQKGEGFIWEGNTRTAVADKLKIPYVKASVRYLNGGELVDGPFSVKNIAKIAKTRKGAEESIKMEKEYGDYIRENFPRKKYQNIEEVIDDFKQFKTGGLMKRV